MNIKWHRISFEHSCGRQGTIMEVCVSSDGCLVLSGLCVVCGGEFSYECDMVSLIARSAVEDYVTRDKGDVFDEFILKGKPS